MKYSWVWNTKQINKCMLLFYWPLLVTNDSLIFTLAGLLLLTCMAKMASKMVLFGALLAPQQWELENHAGWLTQCSYDVTRSGVSSPWYFLCSSLEYPPQKKTLYIYNNFSTFSQVKKHVGKQFFLHICYTTFGDKTRFVRLPHFRASQSNILAFSLE